ncbi:MAG: glycoside hydrolase family 3 C-terminal domain-containing protein [Cyclobacteriaceae bacterium]|nr:glycoside hydrolase family 3 C-terminal domain-containing protein [Cyclobacteriaceae bacterium]
MPRVTFRLVVFSCLLLCSFLLPAQPIPPYKNSRITVETRVKDLLSRMTPEEKFRQLFLITGDLGSDKSAFKQGIFGIQLSTEATDGGQILQYAQGVNAVQQAEKFNAIQKFFIEQTRLGIPAIAVDEALHGLVRSGATSFPQSIALAATWDTVLMAKVSRAIAEECKARGISQVLSPVVNLATDVRWGRVEETYGEDPVLSAAMGTAFIRSFEKLGIITTPKHFVVNHGDGGRDSYPVGMDERTLEESYFVPFKSAVQLGKSRSIMTSYNSLNGRPASANEWLLKRKLKQEWGFRGFVISDASATGGANVLHFTARDYEDAGKQAVENGQDVIFQTSIDHAKLYEGPFLSGKVNSAKLDSAVARVLRIKFDIGLFEKPYVPTSRTTGTDFSSHRVLAREAAEKSIVLLKNEGDVLPLSENGKKIALIGMDARHPRLGGYSGPGNQPVSMLDALRRNQSLTVTFAEGCGRTSSTYGLVKSSFLSTVADGKPVNGLTGEYFNQITFTSSPSMTRVDPVIDFQWTLYSPHPSIPYDFFSVRWSGKIKGARTGSTRIGIEGNEGYRLFIGGKLHIDTWDMQSYSTQLREFVFEKDKEYEIRMEYKEPSGNARLRLVWDADVKDESENKIAEAVRVASESDVVVVAAGIEEGEGRDRSRLGLPGRQEEMIRRLAALKKPMVVVLFGGSAITMPWIDQVPAIVHAWYPGEAGGDAIVDVLTGKVNPSGKLPLTFPIHEGQVPLVYNHKPTGRGDDYLDGSGMPLFPFGYGLSYSSFSYSDPQVSRREFSAGETTVVSFRLKNTGKRDGDEVVELYIRDELATVVRPVRELKAFQRVHLKPGEEKAVQFIITPDMLSMLDNNMKRVVEPGTFRIMIGRSSRDVRIREIVTVK